MDPFPDPQKSRPRLYRLSSLTNNKYGDRGIQTFYRRFLLQHSWADLAHAIQSEGKELKDALFRNMTPGSANVFREELELCAQSGAKYTLMQRLDAMAYFCKLVEEGYLPDPMEALLPRSRKT
jgi:hypothetical protein